jgi:hypothetical protein
MRIKLGRGPSLVGLVEWRFRHSLKWLFGIELVADDWKCHRVVPLGAENEIDWWGLVEVVRLHLLWRAEESDWGAFLMIIL